MSVVHVTLLKAVLNAGPETPYYIVNVCLISIAICLQVIVGILALIMSHIHKFHASSAYKERSCEERCCWSCRSCLVRKLCPGDPEKGSTADGKEGRNGKNQGGQQGGHQGGHQGGQQGGHQGGQQGGQQGGHQGGQQGDHQGDQHDGGADSKADGLVLSKLVKIKDVLGDDTSKSMADIKEFRSRMKRLHKYLPEAEALVKLSGRPDEEHGWTVLGQHAEEQYRDKMLKTVNFCQRGINYILYMVFIINILIGGFGMAEFSSYSPTDTTQGSVKSTTIATDQVKIVPINSTNGTYSIG